MSRILFNVYGGHLRTEVKTLIDNNPMQTYAETIWAWVNARFTSWISENMLEASPYTFSDLKVTGSPEGDRPDLAASFIIDFENPNDEDFFVSKLGGKIIP